MKKKNKNQGHRKSQQVTPSEKISKALKSTPEFYPLRKTSTQKVDMRSSRQRKKTIKRNSSNGNTINITLSQDGSFSITHRKKSSGATRKIKSNFLRIIIFYLISLFSIPTFLTIIV